MSPSLSHYETDNFYSQRLQTTDACVRRKDTHDERNQGGACLTEPGDPSDTPCKDPCRDNSSGMVHNDWAGGAKEEADKTDGNGVTD